MVQENIWTDAGVHDIADRGDGKAIYAITSKVSMAS